MADEYVDLGEFEIIEEEIPDIIIYKTLEEEFNEAENSEDYNSASLEKLSSVVTVNPLNPKTKENIQQSSFLEKTLGRSFRSSALSGKRWISIQAHNHSGLNDYVNINFLAAATGLIISVTKQPQTGSGYDPVVEVNDITNYGPGAPWANNSTPSGSITVYSTSTHYELHYPLESFSPLPTNTTATNYPATTGTYAVDLEIIFASGHIEYFTQQNYANDNGPILCPVGNVHLTQLDYGAGDMSVPSKVFHQNVQSCDNKVGFDFYSAGRNEIVSPSTISDYSILTRFFPFTNPAGTLQEVGRYKEYTTPLGGDPPNLNALNSVATSNDATAYVHGFNGIVTPNKNETSKQVYARIDVLFQHNNSSYLDAINNKNQSWFQNNYTYNQDTDSYYDTNYTGSLDTSYQSVIQQLLSPSLNSNSANSQYMFTHTYYYSENILPCNVATTSTSYDVCDTPGNPSYYLTTNKDCNLATIPATDLPGGSNYIAGNVTFNDGQCCTVCTLDLTLSQVVDATYGNNDGQVIWSTKDASGAGTGAPFSSGSEYTIQITNAAGTVVGTSPPSGGNTITDATCDTVSGSHVITVNSSAVILPNMTVTGTGIPAGSKVSDATFTQSNISSGITTFHIYDPTTNAVVNATATNTNETLTFSVNSIGAIGALPPNNTSNPYYMLCALDDDGCEECATFTIGQNTTPPSGCTDSTAVNYNSAAVQDDGSCILCNATSGLLEDPSSSNTTDLFDSTSATSTSATYGSGSHNSDGTLSVTASPVSSAISYMTWDSDSKFEILLYKTVNQGEPSTAAGATQIGSTINAGTLNNVSVAANNFTGLAYGYYTIRVRYVDITQTSTLENCFTEFYGVVQAEVCDDIFNSTYTTLPTQTVLRDSTPSMCTANYSCCILDTPDRNLVKGTICSPIISSEVSCDPPRSVVVNWYYSSTGSSYSALGTYNLGPTQNFGTPIYANANNQWNGTNWFTQSGYYKVEIVATHIATGQVCVEEKTVYFDFPVYGCTDANAHNYNPLAVCNSTCAFPSWDCDQLTGQCIDPWQGTLAGYTAGAYNCLNGAGCCSSVCIPPPLQGCTDSCASNYNSNAAIDDGSCTYTACLNVNATNFQQNCCNNNYYSSSQIIAADNTCCIDPCTTPPIINLTPTNSTGTCTTFNLDGSLTAKVDLTNGATGFTWGINNNQGSLVYADPTTYGNQLVTLPTYSLLGTGNYTFFITDSFNCVTSTLFTINSTTPAVGCTDPAASNYNPAAICDCNCCLITGCMDPNASNYNPNATTPGQCDYVLPPPSPCIPEGLDEDKIKVDACIAVNGTKWLKDYKVGRADECTLMNKWKLILIEYLLSQDNLSCLFNCADIQTADPVLALNCDDLWKTGGPSTGLLHDSAHAGATIASGEGTTITQYDGFPSGWFGYDGSLTPSSNFTFVGDVVKLDLPINHPLAATLNGTIWTLTTIPPNAALNNGMHQGCKNQKIQHYTQCHDYNTISITTTTNYYDNFLNFVNKFCVDCDISIINSNQPGPNVP